MPAHVQMLPPWPSPANPESRPGWHAGVVPPQGSIGSSPEGSNHLLRARAPPPPALATALFPGCLPRPSRSFQWCSAGKGMCPGVLKRMLGWGRHGLLVQARSSPPTVLTAGQTPRTDLGAKAPKDPSPQRVCRCEVAETRWMGCVLSRVQPAGICPRSGHHRSRWHPEAGVCRWADRARPQRCLQPPGPRYRAQGA